MKSLDKFIAPAPTEKKSSRHFINVCVYVLIMSDDTIKIGYTGRFCKRISEIKSQFKLSVKGIHISPFMSCEKAHIVERCFKEIGDIFLRKKKSSTQSGGGLFDFQTSTIIGKIIGRRRVRSKRNCASASRMLSLIVIQSVT